MTKAKDGKLSLFNLITMCVGMIIGAGIFTILTAVFGMTGRSVSIAMLLASAFAIFLMLPAIFLPSVIQLEGGVYTQGIIMMPKWVAGVYSILCLIAPMGFSTYVISMASYFIQLIPGIASYQKIVAMAILTLFFVMGIRGVSFLAKIQDFMVVLLIAALAVFIIGGLPRVQPNYFHGDDFFLGGLNGVFSAASLLVLATTGATSILNFGPVAKKPKRDIPLSMLIGTLSVVAIYFLMSIVASGILPIEQVAGNNLGVVAKEFLITPLYLFFIIGGALFALATSLNSMLAYIQYPVIKCAEDGWIPKILAKRDNKFKYPFILYIILFVAARLGPILFGLPIQLITSLFTFPYFLGNVVFTLYLLKLPKMFPKQWAASSFHVPRVLFIAIVIIGAAVSGLVTYFMMGMLGTPLLLGSLAALVVLILYVIIRDKRGYVHIDYIKGLIRDVEVGAGSVSLSQEQGGNSQS
ncbi:MAG: APC family permease [Treponema sp.]|jgi:APA family basic amino acid/polyamine antiporter|nr:APC family permease [Treponema sp.]